MFFDAMMKGYIPVVLNCPETNTNTQIKYKHSWAADATSWYRPQGEETVVALSFRRELFADIVGVDFGLTMKPASCKSMLRSKMMFLSWLTRWNDSVMISNIF
jgi:hypothetical protein